MIDIDVCPVLSTSFMQCHVSVFYHIKLPASTYVKQMFTIHVLVETVDTGKAELQHLFMYKSKCTFWRKIAFKIDGSSISRT